ncbi:MAG: hypothetical protein C4B59_13920 [Candidatus Methanogaster sp.]|uniref:Uncharacterized protein n=1 Tax=Candidatus Methanogaster sp. TaxID=3386292 RepID=A0AC61KZT1_9EURY|nr:MAG: hypothetical protein C4B59_13920 [ANME-2 cluster archaeon]
MAKKKKTPEEDVNVFAPDVDKNIRKGSAAIAKILKSDPEGRYIRDLIECHLSDVGYDTHDDLLTALALAFDEDVGQTITFPLFANDPIMLVEYERLKVPERVITFLRYLIALYGAKAEHATMCMRHPEGLEHTRFSINCNSDGEVDEITMGLVNASGDSITITDEPEGYLFLVYQILEQLSSIEPDGADCDTEITDAFEKIEAKLENKIKNRIKEVHQ